MIKATTNNMSSYSHNELSEFFDKALKSHKEGNLIEAEEYYLLILSSMPNHADSLHYLGLIKHAKNNNADAITHINKARKYAPTDIDIAINLAIIHEEENNLDTALKIYTSIIEKDKNQAMAHYGLASIYQKNKNTKLFTYHSKLAYSLNPESSKILAIYATALSKELKFYDSINILKTAQKKDPTNTIILSNLIAMLYSIGNIKDANMFSEKYNQISDKPQSGINQNLFNCNYDPNLNLHLLYKKHIDRAKSLPKYKVKTLTENKHKKIRLGYCSSDFRFHSVAFFFQPIIKNHNSNKFEIYCYYNNSIEDDLTHEIKSYCQKWQNIHHLTDQEVIDKIQADSIDILIDLSGYSAGNRIGVFANRTAAIQISYLGYPNTTGLETVDYRIVDNYTDPIGLTEKLNSEELIRLDNSFLCYSPRKNCPDITPTPYEKNGHIIFGSFNNMAKINDEVINLWSEILLSVESSKLLIKSSVFCDPKIIAFTYKRFSEYNISPNQLILKAHEADFESHMATYNEIDIALDPFPYNGTTTTCEALWMGIPVITLLGMSHISRVSASILNALNLNDLIAKDSYSYIKIATELSSNKEKLMHFRKSIRNKMINYNFTNGEKFTRSLEEIFLNLKPNTKK